MANQLNLFLLIISLHVINWRSAMPLSKGKSKKTIEKNFHELKEAHPKMPNKQRIAIVLSTAKKSKKKAKK
jgi:hypothetical protein